MTCNAGKMDADIKTDNPALLTMLQEFRAIPIERFHEAVGKIKKLAAAGRTMMKLFMFTGKKWFPI
jgi:hypothetical protein